MKKTYTKKQIQEAIQHWQKKLNKMNESAFISPYAEILFSHTKSNFASNIVIGEDTQDYIDGYFSDQPTYQLQGLMYDYKDAIEKYIKEKINIDVEVVEICGPSSREHEGDIWQYHFYIQNEDDKLKLYNFLKDDIITNYGQARFMGKPFNHKV